MARLKGFQKLTNINEALLTFFEKLKLKRLEAVQIPVEMALERVIAEAVKADYDLPQFNRSAVDGYAVRAKDTFDASPFKPKTLELTTNKELQKDRVRQIWTGNPIPQGADAVVMLEHTKKTQECIEVWNPVTPGENVSRKGEDVRKSQIAMKRGTRLKPHHIGLLAALGLTEVSVVEKPKVAILSTGNELVDLGCKPKWNQVVDVNRLILSCMCSEFGAEILDLGIVKDDANEIGAKILEGLREAHLLITTGGTSVGDADVAPAAVDKIGEPGVVVHGVAMRPGMPTGLAILSGKPVVMLSGNPVAAMIGFEVFVRPLLFKLLGIEDESRPVLEAKLTHRVASALGQRTYLRVRALRKDGEFFAEPIRTKGSGILSTMTKANGYVMIPEDRGGLQKGESVIVYLFDKIRVT